MPHIGTCSPYMKKQKKKMIYKEAESEADGLKQIMAVKREVEEPLFLTF